MYTVEHDLSGFVELHKDGVLVAKVWQRHQSLEADEQEAQRIAAALNARA
jgi:hypothetical protein